jgi:metal-responsive CopG/Arc/MetJ family transcriptional regulator
MKLKTSVTLSEETVRALDEAAGATSNRSRWVEVAVEEFLARRARAAREKRDREILDRRAEQLNREMRDVLEFQADV